MIRASRAEWLTCKYNRKMHVVKPDDTTLCGAIKRGEWHMPLYRKPRCAVCEVIDGRGTVSWETFDRTYIPHMNKYYALPSPKCPGDPAAPHEWSYVNDANQLYCPVCDAIGPEVRRY